jgi:hypothetical protein
VWFDACGVGYADNGVGSADATINSQATGAMSHAFISALRQNGQQSYVELLNSIREILETKYTQRPQLSSSHPIGTSTGNCDIGSMRHFLTSIDTNILFVM